MASDLGGYAFPAVLLVYDEVEVVEAVFGRTRFFSGFLRQNTVEFCGNDQFLPGTIPVKHEQAQYVKKNAPMIHPPTRTQGTAASTIGVVWERRKPNPGNIPTITENRVSARSDLVLRSLIFRTNASVF